MKWLSWRRDKKQKSLEPANTGSWMTIFDFRPGAWQSNASYQTADSILAHSAVFACISLISGDIAKLRPTMQTKAGEIWREVDRDEFNVLQHPNTYQNHIRFKQHWIESKLIHGNTYALKQRNGTRITALHILDPQKVTPLVSDSGEVFYKLSRHRLANLPDEITVPAREIIHDRWNCLFHPLVGLPPIFANAAASRVGLEIQDASKSFFGNGARPSGILTAPGQISTETAERLKASWATNYSGENIGKVAVLGDGLKFEPMAMTAVDAQLIEQLKWSAETVCSTFHVPAYMVGYGQQPTHNNVDALVVQYYSQCLQILIEDMETSLDEGLRVPAGHRVQMDLDRLFRMDLPSHIESLSKAVGSGIFSPDEARARLNYGSVPGGKYPYLQQQNYSLEALAARDKNKPASEI